MGVPNPCRGIPVTGHANTLELDVFRAVAKSSPEALLLVASDTRIAAANELAASLLGTRSVDLEEKTLDRVFQEPRQTIVQFFEDCSGPSGQACCDLTPRDGECQEGLRCSATPLEPMQSRPQAMFVLRLSKTLPDPETIQILTRQVSELRAEVDKRKQIKVSLEAAQARVEAILETAVDGIVTIDSNGIIHTANGAMVKTFGYQAAELIGRNISLLMPAPHRDEHDQYIREYLRTGIKRIIGIGRVVSGLRKDGSEFPMELKVGEFSVRGERRFAGFVHDITERRRMEETLRQREETLRITLEQAPSGIVSIGIDGRIQNANRAFCRILGCSRRQLIDRYLPELCHPDDDLDFESLSARLIRTERPSLSFDCRLLATDGHTLYVQMYLAVPRDRDGNVSTLIVQIVDRSEERRHADEAREHRERLAHVTRVMTMGEMAAGIAHEINQPLAAIATYSQACHRLIAAGTFDKEELLEAMSEVTAQAERAGEVIRRLRAMVKKGHAPRQITDINALVSEGIRLANIDAQTLDTQIELDLTANLPPVEADVIQVQQVILNLIRNGIDARAKGKALDNHILVTTAAHDGDHLVVAVRDRGLGISEDVADSLFKPFFTTKGTGMGMGLAISQSIIRAHGGRLWFERHKDSGTSFCFTLPCALETSNGKLH
jgi:two-component system sensor kinase FixL